MPFVKQVTPARSGTSTQPIISASSQEDVPASRFAVRKFKAVAERAGVTELHEIDAEVLGMVAVHLSLENLALTRVSSLTLGIQIVRVASRVDARRIAAVLWDRCPLALRQRSKASMISCFEKHHPWVPAWCRACQAAGGWVEPPVESMGSGSWRSRGG